jgi:hypothetical protein
MLVGWRGPLVADAIARHPASALRGRQRWRRISRDIRLSALDLGVSMKFFSSRWHQLLFAFAAATCSMASATTVVLDSTVLDNAVTLTLDAGKYDVKYVSGAWTPWADVLGCDQNGAYCENGWVNSFYYETASTSWWIGDGIRYATAAQAEANGIATNVLQVTLTQAGTLTLSLPDGFAGDNTGTVTLSVSAVPEPSEAAMLAGGLLLMGAMLRRRKATR